MGKIDMSEQSFSDKLRETARMMQMTQKTPVMKTGKRNLVSVIFGGERDDVDMQKLWEIIDTCSEQEAEIMRALYDTNGEPTELRFSDLEKTTIGFPRPRTLINRALRRVRGRWRKYIVREQFTHRNGESEPPTEEGVYWYACLTPMNKQGYMISPPEIVEVNGDQASFIEPYGIEKTKELKVKWWGPITPPWEADA